MSETNTLMTEAATITDATASQEAAPAAETTEATAAPVEVKQPEATEAKAAEVPESYADFEFSDGAALPEGMAEQIKAEAKDLGLSQAQAQKLADRELKRVEADKAKQAETVQAFRSQWADDARGDKEFGGDKFDANLATARKALDAYGSDTLKGLLDVSGMGNHPEFIRFCFRAGKGLSEDSVITGNPPADARDPQRLYPNSKMNP